MEVGQRVSKFFEGDDQTFTGTGIEVHEAHVVVRWDYSMDEEGYDPGELTVLAPVAKPGAMTVEGTCQGVELAKRQNLPGVVLKYVCPKCGTPQVFDLGDRYLSHPVVGEPEEINGYCEQCDHDWVAGRVIVRMTLELA